jgi:CDP-diacylglycerol--glycerol-3-phosphate 3-phosphatidyltransferase
MNLPNILTVGRIIFAFIFLALIGQDGFGFKAAAALAFVLGSLTDLIDGYLARKHNLITDFGKIMDPIADKCLMLTAFYVFMRIGFVMPWAFWLIAVREVSITAWRLHRMSRKEVLPAETLGKYKTAA